MRKKMPKGLLIFHESGAKEKSYTYTTLVRAWVERDFLFLFFLNNVTFLLPLFVS
jgi:hypothetical protein